MTRGGIGAPVAGETDKSVAYVIGEDGCAGGWIAALRREAAGAIVPKILEVDRLLRGHPARREIVREAHPELCFFFLNGGRPMREPKKTAGGQGERVALLRKWCGAAAARALDERRKLGCQAD